ncbi:MAG: YgcG family protein [Burkholderiales bacterium]
MYTLNAARASLFAALFFILAAAFAQNPIAVPERRIVTDLTGTLSEQEQSTLTQKLRLFESQKGSQIAVLIVPTTQPETIEQYALRVSDSWKLGRKGIDDGALLLIAKDDRKLRIETRYGLEGPLPDAIAKRIIAEVITPLFKHGDFYGGIDAGVDRILKVVDGEPLPAPQKQSYNEDSWFSALPLVILLAFVSGAIFRAMFGRFFGSLIAGGVTGVIAWIVLSVLGVAAVAGALAFLFNLFAGAVSPRSGWSNRGRDGGSLGGILGGWGGGRGGGGWGGGSSGGFGGSGGGMGGGGGASGQW